MRKGMNWSPTKHIEYAEGVADPAAQQQSEPKHADLAEENEKAQEPAAPAPEDNTEENETATEQPSE